MIDYDKILSDRAKQLKPSGIRKFFDVVSEVEDTISLGVGEPDFTTPWGVRDAAISSIERGYTRYTSNSGTLELRELIARYAREKLKCAYDPLHEIIVTVGASEGIDVTLRALLNDGDEVLIPEPSYVSYAPCVTLAGGVAVGVPCRAENDFKLLAADVAAMITERTKAIVLPYPNNPTGAVMERAYLEPLAKVIEKAGLICISDEIYCELTYGEPHVSIASLPGMRERTVLINGFSKAFSMTGWRVGYILAPKEICSVILKIHQYVIMCAPTMSQYGAAQALRQSFSDDFTVVSDMRNQYDMRRRFMVNALREMGLSCFEPRGAFYVFPSVASLGLDGDEFAERLLKTERVAVVPGAAFGESGKDHVRMSYAYSMRDLDEAIGRIARFVQKMR